MASRFLTFDEAKSACSNLVQRTRRRTWRPCCRSESTQPAPEAEPDRIDIPGEMLAGTTTPQVSPIRGQYCAPHVLTASKEHPALTTGTIVNTDRGKSFAAL